jgi:HAD superfamily hydrolase (TIGR01509 family)
LTDIRCDGATVLDDCDAVLFDKDGTLIDIHHYWVSMIRLRASLLVDRFHPGGSLVSVDTIADAMGVDLETGRMKRMGPVGVESRSVVVSVTAEALRSIGATTVGEKDVEASFVEVDERSVGNMAPLVHVLPGVVELLDGLKSAGVPAVVVTTDLAERARVALRAVDLLDRFSFVIGGDQVERTKPAPDLALAAVSKLGVEASRVVVVGDHPVDVGMATAAGCGAAVGVLTGLADEDGFDGEPCVVASDLTHLSMN